MINYNKTKLPFFAIVVCFLFATDCKNKPKEFIDKQFVIASKETVKIKELDITITNDGCGRKWVSEGNNPSYEVPYCGLEIKCKDSTVQAGTDFKPIHIGNIEITLDRINPWSVWEDHVPPGGCRVWVRQLKK